MTVLSEGPYKQKIEAVERQRVVPDAGRKTTASPDLSGFLPGENLPYNPCARSLVQTYVNQPNFRTDLTKRERSLFYA